MLKELFGYSVIDLVEYDLDKNWNIALTFFDNEDFVEDYYSVKDPKYKKLKRLLDYEFTRRTWFRFINIVEFNKTIKKADEVISWIDYMRLSIDWPIAYFEKYLKNLDFENSNFAVDEKNLLTWTKLKMQHWTAVIGSTVYENIPVPIILYTEFDSHNQKMLKTYWKIDLYGSFYRLMELWFIQPEFIENLVKEEDFEDLDILNYSNITRLDYKIDLMYKKKTKIPNYKKILSIRKNSKIWQRHNMKKADIKEEILRWEELQSWAYGSKSAKRVFLRTYDKLADTEAKWKYMLYKDYYNFKSVYRIEFELLNHFCKGFTYIDYKELVEKFRNSLDCRYMWKVFYNYNQKPNLEEIEQRIRYFKDFIWRWETILQQNFNPFVVLYKGLQNKSWKITDEKLIDLVYDLYKYVSNEKK